MIRVDDDTFKEAKPDMDNIIAIRIQSGNIYFLGWMECAENYNIMITNHPENNSLNLDSFSDEESLYNDIVSCDGYNDCSLITAKNPYSDFLSYINCFEKDGQADTNDHEIFCFTSAELYAIVDSLRDGDYVFIIDNFGRDIVE